MIWALVAIALLLLVTALVFNLLVQRRNAVENAFGAVDVYLAMRYDLIPQVAELVRSYAGHERERLTEISALRGQAEAPTLDSDGRVRVANKVGECLQGLVARLEALPELRASEHFERLQRSLVEVEERLSASRRAFNASVTDFNNAVEQFPLNLIAQAFGFRRRAVLQAPAQALASVSVAAAD
jgi:LemA protein